MADDEQLKSAIDAALAGKQLTLEELATATGRPMTIVETFLVRPDGGSSRQPDTYGRVKSNGAFVYFLAKPLPSDVLAHPPLAEQSPSELAYEALADRLKQYGAPQAIIHQAELGHLRPIRNFIAQEKRALAERQAGLSGIEVALAGAADLK